MQRLFVKEFVEHGINGVRASTVTQQMLTYVLGPLPQLLQALGE